MAVQTISIPLEETLPFGEIVAAGVSPEAYMQDYEGHYEWVKGYVIKMSPVTAHHNDLMAYLLLLFKAYFGFNPIGVIKYDPFVMRLDSVNARRQPDLQIILNTNPGELTETYMDGPADICIEIVSKGNEGMDYGEKFAEYEAAGVPEYWILDPIRKTSRFNRLNEEKVYALHDPDSDGYYRTSLLPRFALHVPTLWQEELPDFFAVGRMVEEMFKDER